MARGLRWAVNCTEWIPSKQEWLAGLTLLQSEEAERVSQFVFRKDAKLALVGRLLMRAGLSELLQVGPMKLRFSRGEKGKPLLINNDLLTKIGFNVSHQGDFSVFAAEFDCEVGVDVMQLDSPRGESIPSFFLTMQRQFTSREWQQIKQPQLSHKQQLDTFYRFWCLKESFIKAKGSGLSFGLQNLEFVVDPGEAWPPVIRECCTKTQLYIKDRDTSTSDWVKGQSTHATEWVFQESVVNQQHCAAVALGKVQGTKVNWQAQTFLELTVQDLLSKLHPAAPPPTSHLIELCDEFMMKRESPSTYKR